MLSACLDGHFVIVTFGMRCQVRLCVCLYGRPEYDKWVCEQSSRGRTRARVEGLSIQRSSTQVPLDSNLDGRGSVVTASEE